MTRLILHRGLDESGTNLPNEIDCKTLAFSDPSTFPRRIKQSDTCSQAATEAHDLRPSSRSGSSIEGYTLISRMKLGVVDAIQCYASMLMIAQNQFYASINLPAYWLHSRNSSDVLWLAIMKMLARDPYGFQACSSSPRKFA